VLFSRTIDLVQKLRAARRDPSPPTLAKRQALYRAFSEQQKSIKTLWQSGNSSASGEQPSGRD
jgi:hypothetical protein